HLLYARFWHKFLFDSKYVNYDEPFKKLRHVGLILGADNQKMSKRWGNVVNPDDVIAKQGADALRVYEMFMGPFGDSIAWSVNGVIGARRFLDKVWNLGEKLGKENQEIEKLLHQTIKKVGNDFAEFKFNTALAQMMIFTNRASEQGLSERQYLEFIKLLAPVAPHIAEEIWQSYYTKKEDFYSIFQTGWPIFDENQIKEEKNIIPVQINGRLRARIEIGAGSTQEQVERIALDCNEVKKWIENNPIKKVIYVKEKMLNIII
ncbi:MAG TPA: class I tRNA ligase family protein, partial [Candidatus Pacearchaeota archaeon]|nr:class I tRNA ligase family protein [Candidatus Pacearchaeota archaeon]